MTYLLREVTNEYRRINRNNRIRIRIIHLQKCLPALIWLILVFAFSIRFEKALDRMECGKDEYKCLEDEDE